jgi:3-oxoacyl-[acyl-carrier-protein] synthase-3
MSQGVFLNGFGVCLPNAPVSNDSLEEVLGLVNGLPSKTKRLILRNNGIKSRHYAVDPKTFKQTHSNITLTTEAIRNLAARTDFNLDKLELLTCGTSSPDQLIPSHGVMVHGDLQNPPCEVMSAAGVCCAGMSALKYAYMNILCGLSKNAIATGSELSSNCMKASRFEADLLLRQQALEENPMVAFEHDFLRWMLSDGAGAALLGSEPLPYLEKSLRIDWIEMVSYASEFKTCMYSGAKKMPDGNLQGWREVSQQEGFLSEGMFHLGQDIKLLGKHIGPACILKGFRHALSRHSLAPDDVTWFLPHYSSEYFRQEVEGRFEEVGFSIPQHKWFTNLTTKGNTGSASIYIILEELFYSDRLKKGDKILCFVPESARFSVAYMLVTVV